MRERLCILLVLCIGPLAACGASRRLNQDKAREKIQELGLAEFNDKQIQVEKIVHSGEDQAVAEANITLAFRLSKSKGKDWKVNAIRLGDRNWMEIKAFQAALNEVKVRMTRESLQRLQEALKKYKEKTGSYPETKDMVKLTDVLFPAYMAEVIRYDGWNRELILNSSTPSSYEILSLGSDGIRGSSDDITLGPQAILP